MSAVQVDAQQFWRDGYMLVKRLFSLSEIEAWRRQAYTVLESERAAGRTRTSNGVTYVLGDLLSKDGLREIVLDERVRSVARQILGAEPVYFGNSSYQIGGPPKTALGWHKDNRLTDRYNKKGLDWQTDRYPVIRLGIYFQDHSRHSGGVAIRKGSNHHARTWVGKPLIVPAEPGDMVVWSLTTTHSGQALRMKHFGNRAMGGRWMRFTPRRLIAPEERERVSAFITYGREGAHLDRYIDYIKTERAHDEMEWWRESRFGDDVWKRVEQSGLKVMRLIPEYGTPLS
jgi:hypothetical protein